MCRRSSLVWVTLVCFLFGCSLAVCPWAATGVKKWSAASTWPSGSVPLSGNVTLPVGVAVVYDITTTGNQFYKITVPATSKLIFDGTKNVTLETNHVEVQTGAYFYIGSQDCPYTTKATITFFGPRDIITQVDGLFGNKGIINSGTLEFVGNPPQPTWTRVSSSVPVGSTSFTVQDSLSNWKSGDRIFIASTDFYQELTEEFTIVSVVGQTITIDRPTKYLHYGADNENAEVGILTRNILLQGDPSSETSQFGGHVLSWRNTTDAHVYGVEFTRMGQRGVLARYPFHYHMMGDQIGRGQFVEECSFHHNYQRCLTVHGTSGVQVQNNVGFNVTGHCFFLEEGAETWNNFYHNLGAVVNPGPMIPTDASPSVFWITNPNNSFVGNVAVGGVFGFWYSLPVHPLGMSASQTWIYPQFTPFLLFENNTAHSASSIGVFADFCPNTAGQIVPECTYTPLVPPYTATSDYTNTAYVPTVLKNVISYKNREYGMWCNMRYLTVDNALLMDNGVGCNFPRTATIIQNSVFVAETNNIGTPNFTPYFDDMGRSRPMIWHADFNIHGFEGYDIEGSQMARNVTFVGFTTNAVRGAGAVSVRPGGENVLAATNILSEITLINSNAFILEPSPVPRDGPNHVAIHDADGSLTGSYGSYIVTNNSILTFAGNCTQHTSWSGFYLCQPTPDGFSNLVILNKATGQTNFSDSLSNIFRATFIPFGYPNVQDQITGGPLGPAIRPAYMVNLYSRKGYVMQFPHPTPPKLQLDLHYAASGEWLVVALQYPPQTTFNITRVGTKMTSGASLANLTANTYYFDSVGRYLYLMMYNEDGQLESYTGFPQYGYSGSTVTISASCGNACTVPSNWPIPSAYAHGEDSYRAKLKGCSAGTSSPFEGKAFFNYNPKTKRLTYIIYHSIPRATLATLSNETGVFYTFPLAQSPLRGGFLISWDKHNDLWDGNWTITISSNIASQSIAGRLGCFGSCVAPPKLSALNYCATIPGERLLYDDKTLATPWTGYAWYATNNFSYISDAACNGSSVATTFKSWSGWAMAIGICAPGSCNYTWQVPYINTTQYSFLQFLVKSPSGPLLNVPLAIRVTLGNGVQLGTDKSILISHIENYVIENSWTRVKIPLTYFGLTGNELLGTFTILLNGNASPPLQLLFDKIRLVPDYPDPPTRVPRGIATSYSEKCF